MNKTNGKGRPGRPGKSPMLTAPAAPLILRTALPGMAAMLSCGLCTFLDALLLGRCGAQAASAAALCFPLLTVIQTIGFTFGMGAGSHASHALAAGKKGKKEALVCASAALTAALLLSSAFCCAGFFFVRPLLRLLGAQEASLAGAVPFARFVLACGPAMCANLVLSSVLRGQGKTIPVMAAFCTGSALGAALQFLLIPRFGVCGSGAAMLVREGVTLLLFLLAIHRDRQALRPKFLPYNMNRSSFAVILRFGLPTLLRQGLSSLSAALLTRAAAASGETALAGMGLAVRAAALISSGVIGFGQGFAPVCGFAFGAGDLPRARQAYRFTLRCTTAALAACGAAVFVLCPRFLLPAGTNEAAAAFAAAALRAQCVVFSAQGAVIIMNMFVQAAGMPLHASLIAASRQGYVFIPLVLILPRRFGQAGLILCQSASDLISLGLCALVTHSALRTMEKRLTHSSCGPYGCSDARTASR